MNVVVGMRKACFEGRCMGTAPAGYGTEINSNKHKFIEMVEPAASHLNWDAFKTKKALDFSKAFRRTRH